MCQNTTTQSAKTTRHSPLHAVHLAGGHGSIGPAHAPDPDFPPRALQAPPLITKVAHRATETDMFSASTARRVPHRKVVVHVYAVAPTAAPQPRTAVFASTGGRRGRGPPEIYLRRDRRRGADAPESVKGLLLLLLLARLGCGDSLRRCAPDVLRRLLPGRVQ